MAHPLPSHGVVETDLPIFLNPRAGRGAVAEQPALERAFTAVGANPIVRVLPGNELRNAMREAVAAGAPIIGAAGGDGTISSAASAIAGSQSALLPIPLGTLNHFAMRYGVSSIDAAAHAWERKSIQQIHVGEVGDLIFVNNASVGF